MKNEKEEIAERILEYLKKNPDTGDTLEGISKWWLEMERVDHSVEKVANVLEVLLARGLIKKDILDRNTSIYKLMK